mgnify:CR=1 FL=1
MDLQKIGFGLQKTAVERPKASNSFNLKEKKPLTKEENSLINEKFPPGQKRELELYMASGTTRTENPGSRGNYFDASV